MSFIEDFRQLQLKTPRLAIIATNSENSAYTNWFSQNCYYCELVFNSHDCFGCISRNHAEYEILNVKYPKEEYFKRMEGIKDELKATGEWGKMWIEPTYPFEDTIAAQYYEK